MDAGTPRGVVDATNAWGKSARIISMPSNRPRALRANFDELASSLKGVYRGFRHAGVKNLTCDQNFGTDM